MNYDRINEYLYIGTTPESVDYNELRDLGIELVINMRFERRPHPDVHNPPMDVLWLRTFDTPLLPIPMRALKQGVGAALPVIESGGAVYVHCQAGQHRGVAMGAAILIGRGYEAQEAMKLIKDRRPVADPYAWYIRRRIEKFERNWNKEN